jgi:hypothetical protein
VVQISGSQSTAHLPGACGVFSFLHRAWLRRHVREPPATFWMKVPAFAVKNSTILFGIDYSLPGVFEANT